MPLAIRHDANEVAVLSLLVALAERGVLGIVGSVAWAKVGDAVAAEAELKFMLVDDEQL